MSGSRSFGGNRGDNNRNVRGRVNPHVPALPDHVPIAPPQPPVVLPPQPLAAAGGGAVVPPPQPLAAAGGGAVVPPPQPLAAAAGGAVVPPPQPLAAAAGGAVVPPPQPLAAAGGGAAPPPLVQVRGYSVIPGFPPYPLDGFQTNVYQLFKKELSRTDVDSILHVTGKNLTNFHHDVRDLLVVDQGGERYVRLRLVRGNEVVADGDIKLKRQVSGTGVYLVWRPFALQHHVPLAGMVDQVVYAWCEWVKVEGVMQHNLGIVIKLPN